MLQLVLPQQIYMPGYLEALGEDPADSVGGLVYDAAWQALRLKKMHCRHLGLGLKPRRVPETAYWLVENGVYIGEGRFRHWLAPHLLLYGGHLGYAVRPSRRGRGYGTALLGLLLHAAAGRGLATALIMCEDANAASRRIIEKHNGRLHDVARIEIDDVPYTMRRYLIDTP